MFFILCPPFFYIHLYTYLLSILMNLFYYLHHFHIHMLLSHLYLFLHVYLFFYSLFNFLYSNLFSSLYDLIISLLLTQVNFAAAAASVDDRFGRTAFNGCRMNDRRRVFPAASCGRGCRTRGNHRRGIAHTMMSP